MRGDSQESGSLPVLAFRDQAEWGAWLEAHHASTAGVFMRLVKAGSQVQSISHAEALDIALCYGWIDGIRKGEGPDTWLQKWTPRGKRSIWSKVNTEKVSALVDAGRMRPAGQAEIDRAKADGRWQAAYEPQRTVVVPPDLQAALEACPAAQAFFLLLNSQNRYAILFRLHQAKTDVTRAKRIEKFVGMLQRGEKLHP